MYSLGIIHTPCTSPLPPRLCSLPHRFQENLAETLSPKNLHTSTNTMSTLLLLSGLLAATGAAAQNTTAACVTGDAVHMIIARASLEAPGPGIIGNVATMVMSQLPGSDMEAVVYPATLENYPTSEAMGVSAMTTLVTDYASRCPSSKMVLMGYSQGAQVTMDVLCGTDETNFAVTKALSTDVSSKGMLCWRSAHVSGLRPFANRESTNSRGRRDDGRPVKSHERDFPGRNIHKRRSTYLTSLEPPPPPHKLWSIDPSRLTPRRYSHARAPQTAAP